MKILNLFLVSSKLFLVGVSLSLLSPFYPTQALAKGVSVTMTGLVIGTAYVTVILATPLCGKYVQKLGARRFLILGAFLIGAGNIFFGFLRYVGDTTAFFSLSLVIRFVIALGDSAVAPTALTLAGKQVSETHKGKVLAVAEAFFAIGTMFGPAIGGYLFDFGGFSSPFFVTGSTTMLLSFVSLLCFKDQGDVDNLNNNVENISWMKILNISGVPVGIFSIVFAGIAKRWYAASLGPFLSDTFDLTSSQIGLVFMPFGLVYSFCAPLVGILTDRGLDHLLTIIIGNSLISLSLFLMGPIPPLIPVMGQQLSVTVAAIGLQGVGSGFSYIGSFVYMNKQVAMSDLPKSDQANAMVSSLWLTSECLGCLIGSTLGSFFSDILDFETGTMNLACAMCGSVFFVVICMVRFRSMKKYRYPGQGQGAEEPLLSNSRELYQSYNAI